MIASLFMYHYPELVDEHNRFWTLIHRHLKARRIASAEILLQAGGDLTIWEDPQLVFSQTCGMPYRTWLHAKVELIGTPDYALAACPPGYYRSALVVRANDPRLKFGDFAHAMLAYNNAHSQSGYVAPYWHAHDHGFWFANRLDVGRHFESARAVASGVADIAALDAVSWALMQRYADFTNNLRVLEWTVPTPGLPYITAKGSDANAIFAAVADAIGELSGDDRDKLLIRGIVRIAKEEYLAVKNP